MQQPRLTVSATLPVDTGLAIERFADAMGISRSRLIVLCIRKALPLIVAESADTLNAAQLPEVTIPTVDFPKA